MTTQLNKITGRRNSTTAIKDEWFFMVQNFCENNDESITHYAKDRNTTWAKAYEDCFQGKLGEFAAREIFQNLGIECGDIDLEIRKGKNKGWVEDIILKSGDTISIKTYKKSQYEASWVWQKADPIFWNGTKKDWVGLMMQNDKENTISLYGFYRWGDVAGRFAQMNSEKHRKDKTALYARDLPN